MSPLQILEAYESLRSRLPAPMRRGSLQRVANLGALMDRYQAFFFDAFGVLNIGAQAIPEARTRVQELRAAGKTLRLVSNAASLPAQQLHRKYADWGLDFSRSECIFSRDVLLHHWREQIPQTTGVMTPEGVAQDDLPHPWHRLDLDPGNYHRAERFVLLGSAGWSAEQQELLESSLARKARPVWVANADLVAPHEQGFSLEPGHFAARLERVVPAHVRYFGKPHPEIFARALQSLAQPIAPSQVLMIGDTLHTDILGAQAMGMATLLVTANGASRELDLEAVCTRIGLAPDYVSETV